MRKYTKMLASTHSSIPEQNRPTRYEVDPIYYEVIAADPEITPERGEGRMFIYKTVEDDGEFDYVLTVKEGRRETIIAWAGNDIQEAVETAMEMLAGYEFQALEMKAMWWEKHERPKFVWDEKARARIEGRYD